MSSGANTPRCTPTHSSLTPPVPVRLPSFAHDNQMEPKGVSFLETPFPSSRRLKRPVSHGCENSRLIHTPSEVPGWTLFSESSRDERLAALVKKYLQLRNKQNPFISSLNKIALLFRSLPEILFKQTASMRNEESCTRQDIIRNKGKQSEWFFNCIRPTILVVSKVCFSPPWKETECQIQVVIGAMWFTYRLIHYSSKWESWFSKMIFIFRLLCSHNPSEFVTLIVLHVLEILLMITLCLK